MFFVQFANLCLQRKISVYKAVAEMGLSRSVVTRWKAGSVPNGNTLNKIANYFGVSVNKLLLGETPSNDPDPPNTFDDLTQDEALMFALFGGEATPEQLEEVKRFAAYVKARDEK